MPHPNSLPTELQIWPVEDVPPGLACHVPLTVNRGWAIYVSPGTPEEFVDGLVSRCRLRGFRISRASTANGGVLLVGDEPARELHTTLTA